MFGQRFPDAEAYAEPRLKAGILLSPSPGRLRPPQRPLPRYPPDAVPHRQRHRSPRPFASYRPRIAKLFTIPCLQVRPTKPYSTPLATAIGPQNNSSRLQLKPKSNINRAKTIVDFLDAYLKNDDQVSREECNAFN